MGDIEDDAYVVDPDHSLAIEDEEMNFFNLQELMKKLQKKKAPWMSSKIHHTKKSFHKGGYGKNNELTTAMISQNMFPLPPSKKPVFQESSEVFQKTMIKMMRNPSVFQKKKLEMEFKPQM